MSLHFFYRLRLVRAFIHNGLNLLSKLTPRRLWNALLVYGSYYLSVWTGRAMHRGMPLSLSVEPTTACNLRCPECPSGLRSFTRPTGHIALELYEHVLEQLAPDLIFLTLYFQGEPYIHPRFLEMVRLAANKGLYTISSTNAHFLTEENARATVESGLDRLIVSLDGLSQETYESYRREGNLEEVLSGLRRLLKWKKRLKSRKPHVVLQFLVVRPNEHEIPAVHKLARELGVDELQLKTAQIYEYENGHPLIPADLRYSRYKPAGNGRWVLKKPIKNRCLRMWQGAVLTWDGRVLPCCFDKDARHQLGQIPLRSFREIWKGENYDAFRQKLLRAREEIGICGNCTE